MNVRWAKSDEVPLLQAYLNVHWRKDHILARDEELFRWQYRKPGAGEDPGVLIAIAEGKILGMMGTISLPMQVSGERIPGSMMALWSVREQDRPKGVGLVLLRELIQQGHAWVGVLGANPATTLAICGRLGFQTLPKIPRYFRFYREDLLQPFGLTGKEWKISKPVGRNAPNWVAWSEISEERWDAFWESESEGTISVDKRSTYLRWRYLEHPRFQYEMRALMDERGFPQGLIVWRIEIASPLGIPVVRVVEWIGLKKTNEMTEYLDEVGIKSGAAFADYYDTNPHLEGVLEKFGWLEAGKVTEEIPSRFQPIDHAGAPLNGAVLCRHSQRHLPLVLTRSDGDQDRPN